LPIARRIPAHDRLPEGVTPAELKARARAAWLDAKAKAANILPVTIADKLWANCLLAIEPAPDVVRVVMLHRLETTFRLLVDQARWGSLEPPAPGAEDDSARRRVHGGRWSQWSSERSEGRARRRAAEAARKGGP
jgi:hypothetical protein